MPPLPSLRTMTDKIHEIRKNGNVYFLLNAFIGAYNRRTDVMAQGGGDNSQVLEAINTLTRKVETMSSNIDRIEKEAADLTEDVGMVRTAVDGLSTTIMELKTTVADLQTQIAQGQLDQARLDAAAASLEKADDDLDAITLPGSDTITDTTGGVTVDEG